MTKNRLEAFSDGVIAIIITIMVLELKIEEGEDWHALLSIAPKLMSYVLSFVMVGIYWNNHHHLIHSVTSINGKILWANLHLLFWLSLVPFVTAWVGDTKFAEVPLICQGLVMLMAGTAYYLLSQALLKHHGTDSSFAKALGGDFKGIASMVLYLLGIGLTLLHPWLGFGTYIVVAAVWLIPDRRFERQHAEH